ncbi:MAG: SGNH/GDSL hydrolase family protein [Thiobacillus sp.]|nr:SGNH/GDSL hydrolase family protein [Thiobacillus sp.]
MMFSNSAAAWARAALIALVFALPGMAGAQMTFSHLVVFGTSLSDPGNAFALLSGRGTGLMQSEVSQNRPPYDSLDESLVPSAPYAKGGHHFSNGATWVEQFAQARGLAADVAPAFRSGAVKARNYAVGGARAIEYPDRVNLPQQLETFLGDVGQVAPPDALYVIEMGNNDLRDALVTYFGVYMATGSQGQAAAAANAVVANALNGIAQGVQTLYTFGARKFLVWNAARIDLVPAVQALGPGAVAVATALTDGFNQGLAQYVAPSALGALPGIQIAQLDISGRMQAIIQSPAGYGLANVTDPCVTPNTPPFTCQQPDSYFFWDGIHPTKAVHALIVDVVADALAH